MSVLSLAFMAYKGYISASIFLRSRNITNKKGSNNVLKNFKFESSLPGVPLWEMCVWAR